MMITRYQIIRRNHNSPTLTVGKPYKTKQRARNRCDKLDNEYGSYVHFIEPVTLCAWFLLCENVASTTESHPILGDVPICGRCSDKVAQLGSAS